MVYKRTCFKVTLKLAAKQLVQTLHPEKGIGFRTKVKKNLENCYLAIKVIHYFILKTKML